MPRPSRSTWADARVLRSEGRQYPLEIEYTPHSAAPLEQQVAAALERLAARGLAGHVLVFLPGAAEIRRAQAACAALAQRNGWLLLPLLRRPIARGAGPRRGALRDRRKSSSRPTWPRAPSPSRASRAVIDSGLARVAGHSPWSGLPTLEVARISQASANQRAGRAGRTGPGRAIRLYPLEDFVRRPAQRYPRRSRAPTWRRWRCCCDAMGAARPRFARMAGRAARGRRRAGRANCWSSSARTAPRAARWRAIRCIRAWRG